MASDEPGPGQQYALQSRKHIATLRRARMGIVIEIRWCPAHKGVVGNKKADECAKITAGEPNTHGVEWLSSSGRTKGRVAPLPRSLASLKREISEKKWAEAHQWARGRISKTKYCMLKSQKPNSVVADSTKRLARRYNQLKRGHARTGQYLHWANVHPEAPCWWCLYPTQTGDHLLMWCPRWKEQQKTLWREVYKETGRGKRWWRAHELFAEQRCSQALLDFLTATDVGRIVPPAGGEADAGSEVSEWELWERREREEERRVETEALGAGEEPLFLPIPLFMALAGEE